ncbi:DEDD exonuclease domain-containing protein [Paenibacillus sp. TRM 82003]|uniref:DEDD exonuclease domain-containing protein n=1 Tax=Kineococcus sp. TRM81007 TaxID=2925831 RepID=UPI001F590538|nr:DEDD exonuclease domain-containing protein [Kineococcus sp. TRM81007]MCI2239662.1 DEDD exonuclease domain-containing protein [Kineococcus sp. TRM81007]MCI3926774.1 DEDD exonuclease domain-containing protein [Paenibacillus sp. TRM 82003]
MPAAPPPPPGALPVPVQASFEDLGRPLETTTFVVVDLETTGGSPADGGITEVGAVKVRGGEVLGEFQTLVRTEVPVPAVVQVLTGITSSMVAGAPPVAAVLPAFLEFARGAVLVAHNARYDTAFLAAACARAGLDWPQPEVVDTLALARALVGRDEARDHKLGTLARLLGTATAPDHRALNDARATVDVLHALLGRLGNRGVRTLEDLHAVTSTAVASRRGKKHLAVGLPSAPGAYLFRDAAGRVLYVGTSVDVRRRVASYFTASETRARMTEMVRAAAEVVPVVCATPLEARVRELRLIAEHRPPYNRRSKTPERATWVKLTTDPWPRLSLVRQVRADVAAGAEYLGPFRSARTAELAVQALHDVHPLRRCTRRIPRVPPADGPGACALAELGRCGAPCLGPQRGGQDAASYARVVEQVRTSLRRDASAAVEAGRRRMRALAEQERFEEAGQVRDRLDAFLRAAERAQRRAPLLATPELVAARRCAPEPGWPDGGWELVLVRHGRLAGTTLTPRGVDPVPHVAALRATGEVVEPSAPGRPAALVEETDALLNWLEQPGVRLVSLDAAAAPWALPVRGAGWARHRLGTAGTAP